MHFILFCVRKSNSELNNSLIILASIVFSMLSVSFGLMIFQSTISRAVITMLAQPLFQTTIPHAYSNIDCNMAKVLAMRKDLKGMYIFESYIF